jgi:Sugar-transfer associated ATP-grasp
LLRPIRSAAEKALGAGVLALPDPLKPLSMTALLAMATLSAVLVLTAQTAFPAWGAGEFSPLHIALSLTLLLALLTGLVFGFVMKEQKAQSGFWMAACVIVGVLIGLEFADIGLEKWLPLSSAADAISDTTSYWVEIILVLIAAAAAGLLWWRRHSMVAAALTSLTVYVVLNIVEEFSIVGAANAQWVHLALQMAMLLCLEVFLVTGYSSTQTVLPANVLGEAGLGDYARRVFTWGPVRRNARHPPVRMAFFPVLKETTILFVIGYLLVKAGPALRRASGLSLRRQCFDMLKLWFQRGIDPPTYYAFELYRADRLIEASQLLTRYETKNGLFATLNNFLPNPSSTNEMNDKAQFSALCAAHDIAHPAVLATVTKGQSEVFATHTALAQDLFCKPRKGMGAVDSFGFTYIGNGQYKHPDDQVSGFEGVCAVLAKVGDGRAMLVQPWLRNHSDISNYALDSLIAFRVITCLGPDDEPQITMAMLRLLSKLEPKWTVLPDEEYAASIDIETGELGLFVGDNFATSHIHLTHHPITGAPIAGQIVKEWPALKDIALRAHRACKHRIVVGWDIALTPHGPMMLEGNSNFDVMFLQRVIGKGIGQTALGPLLRGQIARVVRANSAAASLVTPQLQLS